MIGYIFNSIGFGWGDLLLFLFSILAGVWEVKRWRRGSRSLPLKLVTVIVMLFAFVPFVMLGLAFLAAKANAPSAIIAQPASSLHKKGALTVEEQAVIRMHPIYAYELSSECLANSRHRIIQNIASILTHDVLLR